VKAPASKAAPRAKWVSLLAFMCVLLSGTAMAQDRQLNEKFRSGSRVTVEEGETIPEDLYASGGSVEIAGRVQGDLVATGGEIAVNGTVGGDVLAAGGRLTLAGDVAGDVRAAGGQIRVAGAVAEDAVLAGGQMSVAEGAQIGGDLLFSGGRMTLDGRVDGDLLGSAGNYARRGSVGGSENVTTGPEERPPTAGERILAALRRYLAILAVGALLLWLVPRLLQGSATLVRKRPLPSLGVGGLGAVGFVVLLVVLILAGVLISIILGLLGLGSLVAALGTGTLLAAAVLTFAFVLVVVFLADVVVGMAAGGLLLRSERGPSRARDFGALALGVALVVVLTAIPVIGGLLKLLIVLVGLGALVLLARHRSVPGETL
jgi:hypothetical protein